MTNTNISNQHHQTFESIKKTDEEGGEYWLARDLLVVLEYSSWDKFKAVIAKASKACDNSGHNPLDHFSLLGKMVQIGSGAERYIEDYDYSLSRYACYLVVQNGDPSKTVIANGQSYFAIQTRRQELQDSADFSELSEDERRLMLRKELGEHNKALAATAKKAGVETTLDYAIFQDHGYRGLYGGRGAKDIHAKKGLKPSHKILDHMGSTELAANLFRATQTEEKLRRDDIKGKTKANITHYDIGQKVRKTIEEIGGTMPENLPTPEKSIQQVERQKTKSIKVSAD